MTWHLFNAASVQPVSNIFDMIGTIEVEIMNCQFFWVYNLTENLEKKTYLVFWGWMGNLVEDSNFKKM